MPDGPSDFNMQIADVWLSGPGNFESVLVGKVACIIIWLPTQTILRASQGAERLFGYFSQELDKRNLSILIPPRFRQAHEGHVKQFAIKPLTRPMGKAGMKFIGLRKDGAEFPCRIALDDVRYRDWVFGMATIVPVAEEATA